MPAEDRTEPHADEVVLALAGDIDLAVKDDLIARLESVPPTGTLVLDLSRVSFLDSSGIGAILAARRKDRVVRLRGVHGQVRLTLQMAGVTDALEIDG